MMRIVFNIILIASLSLVGAAPLTCNTESQPNPIANQYPNDVTGTINGTTAIIPIPFSVARSIVPSQYGILTGAYLALIPNLPPYTYPAILEAVLDHDVQMAGAGVKVPDFQRAAITFPFIDRLNDGYSSFKYKPNQLISLNVVAYAGSILYGTTYLGTFVPSCNPYEGDGRGTTTQSIYKFPDTPGRARPALNTTFTAVSSIPYSIDVFRNVTNQPIFGSNLPVCDNYITLFNSSVTTGQYAPTPVRGSVSVLSPIYAMDTTFTDVYGYRMDNAFIERNPKTCESLKGYSGTGPGDSTKVRRSDLHPRLDAKDQHLITPRHELSDIE